MSDVIDKNIARDFAVAEQSPRKDFHDWFKHSIVKTEEGAPLAVFHGTSTVFDPEDMFALSHFGTARAAHYRLRDIGTPVVYPVFLRLENPLEIGDLCTHSKAAYRRLFTEATKEVDHRGLLSEAEIEWCFGEGAENKVAHNQKPAETPALTNKGFIAALKARFGKSAKASEIIPAPTADREDARLIQDESD